MCKCCYDVADVRRYTADLEPTAPVPFDNSFEKELTSVHIVKGKTCSIFFLDKIN